MAKKMMYAKRLLEVAPSPLVFPQKPSLYPRLETIREDIAEGLDGSCAIQSASSSAKPFSLLFLSKLKEHC